MPERLARTEKQLGAILRQERKDQGLTQGTLGNRAGLRQATVSKMEDGSPALQLQTLMAALSALNLEMVIRPRTKAPDFEDIF
ncbi:helix-turn-helix domain-containing protein [Insolitispirillum peregrinum]|uniref:Transcriptional regulator, XRE family n=1 Tax=Insolitispirillum peregrinum TaxID=80876 RepID=A0A1N7PLB4_9PROT|nr:helix-turn-helix domain-containing protein [Insolitispirillum peregrinum]SIT11378.1 transcriptional regulator, XRE family [Insolitispirillum peregrinum]